jgi:hypothetical protein
MKQNKDLTEELQELMKDSEVLLIVDVLDINHDPHPFMIGPKHITYAADNCGGMIGEDVLKKLGCAHPGCNTSYEDHKSIKACFIKLKKNSTQDEVQAEHKKMLELLTINKIEGIVLVDTPEKFRIK